MNSDHKKN